MDKTQILYSLLKILNFYPKNIEDITNISFEQKILREPDIINQFLKLTPDIKKHYNSNMLNCIHKNNRKKQRFPAVNMIRQLLKCNKLRLKPYVVTQGYNKATGKKIVVRYYAITLLE